jgi:hypothetical protein
MTLCSSDNDIKMGRTIPPFRNVLDMEKQEWKPFCNALDKSERKNFDEMWDIPRLYITACSNSVQLVPIQPRAISIPFNHYRQLMELKAQIQQMNTKVEDLQKVYPQQRRTI